MAKQIVPNQIQAEITLPITQFKGQRDDLDPKLIGAEFFQKAINWNFPDDGGGAMDKILMPNNACMPQILLTELYGNIDSITQTIPVKYYITPPSTGTIIIDSEIITYTGFNAGYSPSGAFTGCTRGANGSTAAPHYAGVSTFTGIYNYYLQPIDGIKDYQFIDFTGASQHKYCVVSGGYLFFYNIDWSKYNFNALTSGRTLLNYLFLNISSGKVDMKVYQNNLYILRGDIYPIVCYGTYLHTYVTDTESTIVSKMGAPIVINTGTLIGGNGVYSYAMTYVTAGGEEVIGTASIPMLSVQTSILALPLGYTGTISRNIYRTKAGGSTYYLLASIADNTTMTYSDSKLDGSLSYWLM